MTKPIVVVGSINLDLVAGSERIPAPGETVAGKTFNTYFGGKGANQAVAVAKLGHPVTLIGKVGEDVFGGEL
jgi:ribokinase